MVRRMRNDHGIINHFSFSKSVKNSWRTMQKCRWGDGEGGWGGSKIAKSDMPLFFDITQTKAKKWVMHQMGNDHAIINHFRLSNLVENSWRTMENKNSDGESGWGGSKIAKNVIFASINQIALKH
jgi:uncharacterized FlgJ-related protein